ncbi:protein-ADP-ribose hydrolase [uncultured Selenomonas sp.]|uniref:protein-ADP-ribose hydrolase n=1 Tax=uncultured Selenomonas sp. TaxID=159275 RepID=UPI0025EEC55A|nr:protein-ADP-ribose hydrolase [uncultured Selenomonas sp.]
MMEKETCVEQLISYLLDVLPEYRAEAETVPMDAPARRYLLRCLMNVWNPRRKLPEAYFALEQQLLSVETREKEPGIALFQGDITRLSADAIVNAANSQMLGCFVPGHGCIDNAIHSAAGLRLRAACYELMKAQGHEELTGQAKLTPGFALPARYVMHTVGPIVRNRVTEKHRQQLRSCYRSCLELARKHQLRSIAFCCISTGVFHFPRREAAEIAVHEVREYRKTHGDAPRVIFNVFQDEDCDIYEDILG